MDPELLERITARRAEPLHHVELFETTTSRLVGYRGLHRRHERTPEQFLGTTEHPDAPVQLVCRKGLEDAGASLLRS
ncbi:hypothetical protein [Streptomyces canus]|uniref:hypothetical protein n=1 Tax=Streptomyces canus TaxID=58343 RepID=UPI0033A02E9C